MAVITYDLLAKAKMAKNDYDIQKMILEELKIGAGIFTTFGALNLALAGEIYWQINLLLSSVITTIKFGVDIITENKYPSKTKYEAYQDLIRLAAELNQMNSQITPKSLVNAELIQLEIEIRFNENQRLVLQQNKYIIAPTYNLAGKINGSVPLLQERVLLPYSEKRIISVGSPKEEESFRPAFGW